MDSIILSLIMTSQNRRMELIRYPESLNNQVNVNFDTLQLIFVDQGENSFLLEKFDKRIHVQYLTSERCSLSKARNYALSFAKGKYICFPDDDCWYEPDTLSKALNILDTGSYQGISGVGKDENGTLTSSFPKKRQEITPTNMCAAISYTMFFKFVSTLRFDENMGVGSPYNIGSGEESDYMLNLLKHENFRVLYDPNIVVHHPTSIIYEKKILLKKTYSYARGLGYLMQKHKMPFSYKSRQLLRPILGMTINALCMNWYKVRKSYCNFKGRFEGLFVKF